jgi:hypothetical protein
MGRIKQGHPIHPGQSSITSRTRPRSSGTSSASNQGLRRSHPVFRQDGCGKGIDARAPHGRASPPRLGRDIFAPQMPADRRAADRQGQPQARPSSAITRARQVAAQTGGGGRSAPLRIIAGKAEGHRHHRHPVDGRRTRPRIRPVQSAAGRPIGR